MRDGVEQPGPARRVLCAVGWKQLFLTRGGNESGEPARLGSARAAPERGDPVVAWPAAARLGVAWRPNLGHQSFVGKPTQVAIQHRGPEPHASARALEDFVHDSESVQIAIGKRKENLEPVRRQRDVDVSYRCHEYL
jgi:hypothetical protein